MSVTEFWPKAPSAPCYPGALPPAAASVSCFPLPVPSAASRRRIPSSRLLSWNFSYGQEGSAVDPIILQQLDETKAAGAVYHVVTFSTHRLFWQSKSGEELNQSGVEFYRNLIAAVHDRGLVPIATSTTWVLPPFAEAPQVPAVEFISSAQARFVRPACIPSLQSTEYHHLIEIRNQLWATLVTAFPEIQLWMIGYEPGLEFWDCTGAQLDFTLLPPFIADTLYGLKSEILASNPDAVVISHFLGRTGIPLYLRDRLVQPQEILDAYLAEVDRRGPRGDYFDDLAPSLEPALILDRSESSPSFLPVVGGLIQSGHLVCAKTYCDDTAPWTEPGWNIKCCEEFDVNTSDLATYAKWDYVSTSAGCIKSKWNNWVGEWTDENIYGIQVPPRDNSKLLFGFGPGESGEAHAERTGTAYWIY